MLAWMTLSVASKHGFGKRLLLSSRGVSLISCGMLQKCIASEGDCVENKINELMDFTVSVLAAICFCHGRRLVGLP